MSRKKRIHDLELEQFALGELSPADAADVRRRLEEEPGGMERLADLHTSNAVILEEYPPHLMAVQIAERAKGLEASRKSFGSPKMAIPALASAAVAVALVLALMPSPNEETGNGRRAQRSVDSPEVILTKGSLDPEIFVFRKQSDVQPGKGRLLKNRDPVSAGDVLQIRYAARGAEYGVIFSVDGSGSVTLHFPSSKTGSTKLAQKGAQALDYAYELDDAPGFERFFFVTSDSEAIDVAEVLRAGKRLGSHKYKALDLPDALSQTDLLLMKE